VVLKIPEKQGGFLPHPPQTHKKPYNYTQSFLRLVQRGTRSGFCSSQCIGESSGLSDPLVRHVLGHPGKVEHQVGIGKLRETTKVRRWTSMAPIQTTIYGPYPKNQSPAPNFFALVLWIPKRYVTSLYDKNTGRLSLENI
jgi:hypothetical protein